MHVYCRAAGRVYNSPTMFEMLAAYKGQFAALTTAVLWTATALFFTAAGKRLGITVVNATRIAAAIVLLGLTHRYFNGCWLPNVMGRQVLFLALSGVIGLSIGDQALFVSFIYIGPRLSTLIMTTSPIFAALFGWLVLGEQLAPASIFGMFLTIVGVGWVVLERTDQQAATPRQHYTRGILLALVGAACQAGGLLLSKQGIGHGWLPQEQHLAPQTATLVRMTFAGLGMVPLVAVHALRERKRRRCGLDMARTGSAAAGWLCTMGGAVCGPFLGVWMSLVAADNAPLGIAQTLCSMVPLFIVPAVAVIYKERVSPRAVIGAVVAVAGASLLF